MTMMKTLAFAGAMAVMAGTSFGATVDTTRNTGADSGNSSVSYQINGGTEQSSIATRFAMTGSSNNTTVSGLTGSFIAFCVDLGTYIQSPATYTVDNTMFDSTKVGKIQNLFDSSYSHSLTAFQNSAFQAALWTLVVDNLTLAGTSALNTAAQGYLTAAAGWSGTQKWDLTFLNGHGNKPNPSQNLVAATDHVAPVPLPAAGLLLLGGLGGLGIVARRRNKTA